jgi:hypothetical protein
MSTLETGTAGTWVPILTGREADDAREVIEEIAAVVQLSTGEGPALAGG